MKNNPGLAPMHGCWKYSKSGLYLTLARNTRKTFLLELVILPFLQMPVA
jgi:hypothetical protein